MPREVRRVRDMVMRLVDRVGHVDHSAGVIPREIRRQQWSFLNIPLMWAAATGDRSNVVLQWFGCVSTEHVRPGLWREFARQ